MDKDTTDLLERLRQSASQTDEFVRGMTEISCDVCEMAADTIERQAKQIERMMTTYADDQEVLKGIEQERDAAIAEVERLKVGIKGEALKMVEDMYPSEYIR